MLIKNYADLSGFPTFGPPLQRFKNYIRFIISAWHSSYIMTDVPTLPLYIAIVVGRLNKKKIILRYRGDSVRELRVQGRWFSTRINIFWIKKTHSIWCVSEYLKQVLLRYGVQESKIKVMNTPLLMKHENCTPQTGEKYILFVTNFHFIDKVRLLQNYLPVLCAHLARCYPDYSVVVVGGGRFLVTVQQAVAQFGNCVIKGALSQNGTKSYFESARIFCHFSELDAYPTVVQEAMFHGLPVVVNDCCGMSEMVVDDFNGYKINNDTDLLRATDILLSNEDRYSLISNNALLTSRQWMVGRLRSRAGELLESMNSEQK